MNVLKYHQAGLFLISKLVENTGKKQRPVFAKSTIFERALPVCSSISYKGASGRGVNKASQVPWYMGKPVF